VGSDSGETSFLSGSSMKHSVVLGEMPLVFTVRRIADVDIGSILSSGDGAMGVDVDVVFTINTAPGALPLVIVQRDPRIFVNTFSVVPSGKVTIRFGR